MSPKPYGHRQQIESYHAVRKYAMLFPYELAPRLDTSKRSREQVAQQHEQSTPHGDVLLWSQALILARGTFRFRCTNRTEV